MWFRTFALGTAALLVGGLGFALAQTLYPQVASLAGTELVQVIGGNASGPGFSYASVAQLAYSQPVGTASATAGAATLNGNLGVVTSESLTTAAGSDYTLTLTNAAIAATSVVLASVGNGSNTTIGLAFDGITPGVGSATIKVKNTNGSSALNGTIKVAFTVLN